MEQREGYKKTKIGWIPEDWDFVKFGSATQEYKKKCLKDNEYEVLTSSRKGLMRQKDYYGDNRLTERTIVGCNICPPEYITFRSRSDDGFFVFNQNKLGFTGAISKYYPVFTTIDGCNDFFVLLCNNLARHFSKYSVGTSQVVLSYNALASCQIPLPSIPEQKKIASILTTVDDKISSIKHQIQQTEQLKKGLMEKLLTEGIGHTKFKETKIGRIPKGWEFNTIENACFVHNNLRKPISADDRKKMRGEYPYYGPTKIVDYINEYRVDGEYALIGEDGDHFLKYKTRSMTQLANGKFNVNNHAHIIEGKGECSTKWVYHFYKHRNIIQFLTRQGAGRYKLNKASLLRMPIAIPSPKEQSDIIRILSSVDDKIEVLNQKNSHYQTLNSMMQFLKIDMKRSYQLLSPC